jgi:phospholipid/cholesterol/gamma-HCH transport system permease protein
MAQNVTVTVPNAMNPPLAAPSLNPLNKPSHRWVGEGQAWALELVGDWRGAAVSRLLAGPAKPSAGATLVVRAAQLQAWDMGLSAALRELLAPWALAGAALQLQELPQDVRSVLALALPEPGAAALPAAPPVRGLAAWGLRVQGVLSEALNTATFFGQVLQAIARLLRGRSSMRLGELLRQVDITGPLSLPIVGLACFLVGLMLAYMGGAQLDRMGAQRFIASVVTVGMVRELAGLFTGIILAGRIGSAFAAQLATMKAGEEIDALRALGVDPIDHLVLPRVLALVLVAPLVWAYAALAGVLAGLVPSVLVYHVPAALYVHEALEALSWTHLWVGLCKCLVYAALLALAGCREGLYAGRNAQAVGEATTTAVVKALVWIIAAACFSTIVAQSLGL